MPKWLLYLFLFTSGLNIAVFLARDTFQYIPFSSYDKLYGRCNNACIDSWKVGAAHYSGNDLATGRYILDTAIKKHLQTNVEKASSIAFFLYARFHAQAGRPKTYVETAHPLQQYALLSKDKSLQLWCGNYGLMFFYFCWAANVPCRMIEVVNNGNHHIVNEIYDEQSGHWLFVDVTHNLPLVKKANGGYLNLVDFVRYVNHPAQETVDERAQVMALKDSSSQFVQTYYSPQSVFYYYHELDKTVVYSFREKLYRYFLPHSWYEVYQQKPGSNLLFYAKLLLFVCWVMLVITLVILRIGKKNSPGFVFRKKQSKS